MKEKAFALICVGVRDRTRLWFVALSTFFLGTTSLWLWLDQSSPQWDDSWYLTNSLVLLDSLVEGGVVAYLRRFLTILGTKAPLITALPTPFYLIFGRNPKFAYSVNFIFIVILFGALYRIGRKYWSGRVALLAVYITGTMPLFYGLFRWFMTDFPLAALVCLAICLLIDVSDFEDLRKSFLLGVVSGLGLLMKVSFPIYVVLPFLFVLGRRLAKGRSSSQSGSNHSSLFQSMLALILPAVVLSLPWYFFNFREVVDRVVVVGFSEEADYYGTGPVFTVSAIKTYLIDVINVGLSSYYFGLGVLLLLLLAATRRLRSLGALFPKDACWILSLWILPFVVFLFSRNKDIRFIAPFLPVFALTLAPVLDTCLGKRKRSLRANILMGLVLAFPLVSLAHSSFRLLGNWHFSVGDFLVGSPQLAYARPYERRPWPHLQILKALCSTTEFAVGEKKWLMLGTDRAGFNANNFELAAVQARLPLQITTSAYETDLNGLLSTLHSMTFFLYKEGGEGESSYYNRHIGVLLREVRESGSFTELPISMTVPDGGRVRAYKNRLR